MTTQTEAELSARVLGPHADALLAVRGDGILAGRLQAYIDAGGPVVALEDVPAYRRPAVIETALEAWQSEHDGRCRLCGTNRRRLGAFTRAVNGSTTCGACRRYLDDGHTELELLTEVFRRHCGIAFDVHDRVLSAEEAGYPSTEPWGHVPASLRDEVAAGTDYAHFITPAQAWRTASGRSELPPWHVWPVAPARDRTELPASPEATERAQADAAALAKARQIEASAAEARRRNLESADRLGIPVGDLPLVGGHR